MNAAQRLITLLAVFPMIADATSTPAPLHKNMSFFTARKILLKEGWKPINVHADDNYTPMGIEHELAKMNFKEFDSCSIDYSNCIMRYKRGSRCLTVFTIGEEIKFMKVVDWNSDCPALPPPVPPSSNASDG